MVSVCSTCNGLQTHLRVSDADTGVEAIEPLRWLSSTLPSLRASTTAGCRACALILHGILLHHDRFANIKEEAIRISAESFPSTAKSRARGQDHLSVSVRWGVQDDDPNDYEPEQEGYPDLKLEFYTDSGTFQF